MKQRSFSASPRSTIRTSVGRLRGWIAALSTIALLLPLNALTPAQPTAPYLDGVRDPAYVLVAEDPGDDLAPEIASQPRYQWADLTRLYIAADDNNLYVYADLPGYGANSASGQIGLAILLPDGSTTGELADYIRPDYIAYAFSASASGQCPGVPISPVRHPNVLIRGLIRGTSADTENANLEVHFLATSVAGAWQGTSEFWSGSSSLGLNQHVAYADSSGIELHIPWDDLGQAEPTDLSVSFFTTGGMAGALGASAPGAFDSVPSDPQAPPALTRTVLSQMQTINFPLPAPASVSLGCAEASVLENAGTARIEAQLYHPLTTTLALSYTTASLTANPADYTPVSGTLTFGPNTTRQTIAVPITNDLLDEPEETFSVSLSNGGAVALTAPYSTTITIIDNDEAAQHKIFIPFIRRP